MIYSDHKLLISIFENPNLNCPESLERWRLRLISYDFQIRYRPGHDNSSDYMSRHSTVFVFEVQCSRFMAAQKHIKFHILQNVVNLGVNKHPR